MNYIIIKKLPQIIKQKLSSLFYLLKKLKNSSKKDARIKRT